MVWVGVGIHICVYILHMHIPLVPCATVGISTTTGYCVSIPKMMILGTIRLINQAPVMPSWLVQVLQSLICELLSVVLANHIYF